tara:strand:- start:53 stop:475 length:423 start_codon:yes stop_codon:yes gene_type:complete
MSDSLRFVVHASAAPQGSKRHVGRGIMIESSKRVKPFRQDVKWAALEAKPTEWKMDGPFSISVDFCFIRPKSHFTSKGALTKSAPLRPTGRNVGDIEKLLRAVHDALSEVLFTDDSQVVECHCFKVYADQPATIISLNHV